MKILTCRYEMCRIRVRVAQIQPKKQALDHADCTAPIRKHELYLIQSKNVSGLKGLGHDLWRSVICPMFAIFTAVKR